MALKSVLITGCSAGGIGSALVEAFQKQNMLVFATARHPSKMSHLKEIPNVKLLTLDPTSAPSVRAAVDVVAAQTGGTLDYLVNNAGQTIIMPTLDFDIEIAKGMYDINVWACCASRRRSLLWSLKPKAPSPISIPSARTSIPLGWASSSKTDTSNANHPNECCRSLRRLQSSCRRHHRNPPSGNGTFRRAGPEHCDWGY